MKDERRKPLCAYSVSAPSSKIMIVTFKFERFLIIILNLSIFFLKIVPNYVI